MPTERPVPAAATSVVSLLTALGVAAQTPPPQDPTRAPEAPATQQATPERQGPPSTRLPEVVITESAGPERGGFTQTPIDNTAARSLISPQTVREAGAANTQDLLRRTPSVFATDETGSDSLPNVAVRGLTGNEGAYRSLNLAMLVDGIPLASAPYGHPGSSLFPLTLERVYAVDVQRGGNSVRYGPNNVSGTINFLTRPIPTSPTIEG